MGFTDLESTPELPEHSTAFAGPVTKKKAQGTKQSACEFLKLLDHLALKTPVKKYDGWKNNLQSRGSIPF